MDKSSSRGSGRAGIMGRRQEQRARWVTGYIRASSDDAERTAWRRFRCGKKTTIVSKPTGDGRARAGHHGMQERT